jgi:DNA-binding transcriptional LysR family regulator
MDVDPRRLRVLRAVALRGGVVDAARLLRLTPSAVSQQLRTLEEEVGIPLLDRSGRRVELTPAGRLLVARAERIEAELQGARQDLSALGERAAGKVLVAAFQSAVRHLLAPALERLQVEHPEVELGVRELEGPAALRELRTGGVDLVVAEQDAEAAAPLPPRIAAEPLLDDAYRVVVPARWRPRPRSIAALAVLPWVASPPETACGRALERLARTHGFEPRRVHVCVEFPSALALVAAGCGAAIVPALAGSGAPPRAVAVAPVPGVGYRRIQLLYRAAQPGPEPVVRAAVAALHRTVAALRGPD